MSTEPLSTDQCVRLPKIQDGVRECWITVLHDTYLDIDVVIGAGTKQACIDAFNRYSRGAKCNENLVYHVSISKAKDPTS